jgi:hypothetical protein
VYVPMDANKLEPKSRKQGTVVIDTPNTSELITPGHNKSKTKR